MNDNRVDVYELFDLIHEIEAELSKSCDPFTLSIFKASLIRKLAPMISPDRIIPMEMEVDTLTGASDMDF